MHRLAWHDPSRDEGVVRESLLLALLDAGETVMLQDADRRYIFIANLPSVWKSPKDGDVLPVDEEIFGEAIAQLLEKARRDFDVLGTRVTFETTAGDDQIFQFQLFSTSASDGRVVTKITIRDVSVERRREQLLRTLLREVSHRSRNLMAIIQSLSDQTARFSATKEDFLRKFRGRLFALAQSQDLLTDSDWRGAALFELLKQQVTLYLPEYPDFVQFAGEDIFLNPNGAMYLGLAFHELVVNTVSHRGNFARQQRITVGCQRDGDLFRLEWREPVSEVTTNVAECDSPRQSFGSVVLEKVVPVALNGTANYVVSANSIVYDLTFPANSLA